MSIPVLVAALLVLAGCSSAPAGSEPVSLPPLTAAPTLTPSATPSPTASATPSASVALPVPPEATPDTRQGAAAFASYWWDAWALAYQRNDAALIKELSSPGCKGCNGFVGDIEQTEMDGQHYAGVKIAVSNVAVPPGLVPGAPVPVLLTLKVSAVNLLRADGTLVQVVEPVTINYVFTIVRTGSSWQAQSLARV